MKFLIVCVLIINFHTAFSQSNVQTGGIKWLDSISTISDLGKWDSIKAKYFTGSKTNEEDPVLIVDGIFIHSDGHKKYLKDRSIGQIKSINLMVNEPEGWTANKRWQGIIVITLSHITGRRFKRIKV